MKCLGMRIKQMKKICFITEPHRRIIGSVVLRTRQHPDYVLDINDGNTDRTAEGDIVNGSQYLAGNGKNTPAYRRVGRTVLDKAAHIKLGGENA